MHGPINTNLSRRIQFTRCIQLLVKSRVLSKPRITSNSFAVSILQSLSTGILLFIIFSHSNCFVHSVIKMRCCPTDALNYTGWAKSRYTVINCILHTYFWPTLYEIIEFTDFIQLSASVG